MGTIYNATYKVDLRAIRRRPVDHNDASSDFLDFRGLAAKLGTSEEWVRRSVRRAYTRDPIPHLRFGRAIRFVWDSPEMQAWLERKKGATSGKNGAVIPGRAASYNQTCTEFGSK